MTLARVHPMPADRLDEWRAARASDGVPLPAPEPGSTHEPVLIELDGVTVGGALLALARGAEGSKWPRCSMLVLQTTLPPEATDAWVAVASALEAAARGRGAAMLTTAVAPELAAAFGRAGFQATMLGVHGAFVPGRWPHLADDHRVATRPMSADEVRRFAVEARAVMVDGMALSGVADPGDPALGSLDERLAALVSDTPPDDELLLTATLAGRPIGHVWATLARDHDRADAHVHLAYLYPECRGQGMSTSFAAALVRHAFELGLSTCYFRTYARDQWVQRQFMSGESSLGVVEVHVRKDLGRA